MINKTKNNDSHSKNKTLLIDTSIQIERCKETRKSQKVEDAVKEFLFNATSSYAKLEFKRAWLKNLCYLYELSKNATRYEEIQIAINDKLQKHPYHRRKLNTCHQAIDSFLSRTPNSLPYKVLLTRFRSHLRNALLGAYEWWTNSIVHEFNNTGCIRAQEKPTQRANDSIDVVIPKCKKEDIKCKLNVFFLKHKENFRRLADEIKKRQEVSSELSNTEKIIRRILVNHEEICDSNVCSKIGDIIIALDGIEMDCYAANNDAEWKLISYVLKKHLINPTK